MLDNLFVAALFVHGPAVALPELPQVLFCPTLEDSSKGLFASVDSTSAVSLSVNRLPYVNISIVSKKVALYTHTLFMAPTGNAILNARPSNRSTCLVVTNIANYVDLLPKDNSIVAVSHAATATELSMSVSRLCSRASNYTVNGVDNAVQAAALMRQIIRNV